MAEKVEEIYKRINEAHPEDIVAYALPRYVIYMEGEAGHKKSRIAYGPGITQTNITLMVYVQSEGSRLINLISPRTSATERDRINRQIGSSTSMAIQGEENSAKQNLKNTEDHILKMNSSITRTEILNNGIRLTLYSIFLIVISWISRNYLINILSETAFFSWICFCSGGIGAFISISLRIGKIEIISTLNDKQLRDECTARMLVGGIAGMLAALSVKIGIIVPAFNQIGQTHIAMALSSIPAGASERWIKGLIYSIEDK